MKLLLLLGIVIGGTEVVTKVRRGEFELGEG